jgi:hypothetical protein
MQGQGETIMNVSLINIAFIIAFLVTLAIFPCDAKAYIDPGTGSLMLQYVSSGVLIALLSFKATVTQIGRVFNASKNRIG